MKQQILKLQDDINKVKRNGGGGGGAGSLTQEMVEQLQQAMSSGSFASLINNVRKNAGDSRYDSTLNVFQEQLFDDDLHTG